MTATPVTPKTHPLKTDPWVERWKLKLHASRRPSKDAKDFHFVLDRIHDVAPNIFEKHIQGTFYCKRLGLSWIWHDFLIDSGWDEEFAGTEMRKFEAVLRRIGPRTFYNTIRDIYIDPYDKSWQEIWKDWVKFARSVDREEMETERTA